MYTDIYLAFVIFISLSLLALFIRWPLLWLTRRYVPVASSFIATITQVAIFSVAIYAAAIITGVPNAERVTMMATVSVTLALAAQSTVAEIISASKALAAKRFAQGDLITVGEYSGTVQHVTVFGTILNTITGDTVYLPNAMLDGNAITNHTVGGILQMRLRFPVPDGMEHQQMRNVVHAAVQSDEQVMRCLARLNGDHPGNYLVSKFVELDSGYVEVVEAVFWICAPAERELVESWITRQVARGMG